MSATNGHAPAATAPELVGIRVALAAVGTVRTAPLPEGGWTGTFEGWPARVRGDSEADVLRAMWAGVRPDVEARRARLRREADAREVRP